MAQRVVVEWGRSSVRLAVAQGRGDRRRLRSIEGQPIVNGELTEALRELVRRSRPPAAPVIGIIPREHVITRAVRFPTVDEAELAHMVELYAKAQLPYPREQTVMDYEVLQRRDGLSTVVIVACQREVIDRQLALLREAGLSVATLTVSSWAVLGWYRALLRRPAASPSALSNAPQAPTLLVNIDEHRADLVLVAEGQLFSSRSISQGVQDWQALPDASELLTTEIERSRAAIRKELPGTEVRSLLLSGLGPISQWSEYVGQRLGLPVVAISSAAAFEAWTPRAECSISPIVVGGAACSEPSRLLNLSPPELRVQVRQREAARDLIFIGVLAAAVVILGCGWLGVEVIRQRRIATRIEQVIAQIEPAAKQVQAQSRALQLVTTLLEQRRRVATMLVGVFRKTPTAILLEGLTFDQTRGELTVRGNAPSRSTVLEYLKALETVEGVGRVSLKYWKGRATAAGELTDFELTLLQRSSASSEQHG